MTGDGQGWKHGLGSYRGATYSRTWLTMLTAMPLAWLILFSVVAGNSAWIALIPVSVVLIAPLWLVPLSVVRADGVRLVLKRIWIPWSEVDSISDPRPGDDELRVILVDAHSVVLRGVPPKAAPSLRALLAHAHDE